MTVASPFADKDPSATYTYGHAHPFAGPAAAQPGAQPGHHVRSFLALASPNALRLFALTVRSSAGRPLSVTLAFVRKV